MPSRLEADHRSGGGNPPSHSGITGAGAIPVKRNLQIVKLHDALALALPQSKGGYDVGLTESIRRGTGTDPARPNCLDVAR